MKKIFSLILAIVMISAINVTTFAAEPQLEIYNSETQTMSGYAELEFNPNARIFFRNHAVHVGGEGDDGGTWYYGIEDQAFWNLYSYLQIPNKENRTSVQPGADSAVITCGWTARGGYARTNCRTVAETGNRAFYDYRPV